MILLTAHKSTSLFNWPIYRVVCPKKDIAVTVENTRHNFHSFENRCNFFSRWKLLLVSASKFRQHFFCGKQVNVTEQITMLINCRTKTLKRESWRQVRRLLFTGVPIVFYQALKPTSLDSAVSPSACGQSHSASPRLRDILSSKRGSQ